MQQSTRAWVHKDPSRAERTRHDIVPSAVANLYNFFMAEIGKMLVVLGLLVAVAGLIFILMGKTHLPIGRLPGDIIYRGKHTTFYFPLATSIIVSVVLTLVLYLVGRIRH